MNIFIRSARVVDRASLQNGQLVDILVRNGLIASFTTTNPDLRPETGAVVIEGGNLHVSAGWVDARAAANDPGYEHREALADLARVAAAGGFTDVALLPNTQPVVDAKDTLGYLRRTADGFPTVRLHPVAAITKGAKGDDFTDMIDLHRAGAVAFSDGDHPLQHPDLLVKTLQYLRPFGGLLINRPEDTRLTRYGQMHEGIQSTRQGLKGLPALAEVMTVARDLRLLAYVLETEPAAPDAAPMLHFTCLSAAESVALIREAKAQGLPVSCDVAAHQLAYTDEALHTFDSNLKVNPPFRGAADVAALWAGLADGTIDAVVSDHHPHEEETKNVEFDVAEFGMLGAETVFALIQTHNKDRLALADLIDRLTTGPRRVLRLPPVLLAEGQPAALTIFNPTASWTYTRTLSPAKNSPLLGQTLVGNVVGTVLGGHYTVQQ
ncbi:dihydroorotase [Fibrella sp. HMF5335]|uniref:Dihydroorotase n=1 Tax=Fibrella rubiginis TaxID=2817060 RepID=A0A939GCF0_9BACT|nr:dihydroorotase [Fibrella rubiginis]MBO0934985.1 dihydroorotase [Fibrella rubiginis]